MKQPDFDNKNEMLNGNTLSLFHSDDLMVDTSLSNALDFWMHWDDEFATKYENFRQHFIHCVIAAAETINFGSPPMFHIVNYEWESNCHGF